jgi:ParB family chromosome partitioning protein
VQWVEVGLVRPNPEQPRKSFDPAALDELACSLKQHGVLQPIVVRSHAEGFELVSGERRLRAAQLAGLDRIPAWIRDDIREDARLELALVENLQRQDLDAMERAEGYQRMVRTLGITQDQVAERVGLKRSTVANHIRLLELPRVAQDAVRQGLLTMGHARALLAVPDKDAIAGLVERIVREAWSVRDVELWGREAARKATTSKGPRRPRRRRRGLWSWNRGFASASGRRSPSATRTGSAARS